MANIQQVIVIIQKKDAGGLDRALASRWGGGRADDF